jgi:hypothetical protein
MIHGQSEVALRVAVLCQSIGVTYSVIFDNGGKSGTEYCSEITACKLSKVEWSSRAIDKKAKQSRYTPWWRLGERRYSSYSFLTSALDGGEWLASRLGRALLRGKDPPVPIVEEAGWAPQPVWTQRLEEKYFAPAGDRTPITRSSSPYSDTILTELLRLHTITYT